MDLNTLIDSFVYAVNSTPRESMLQEDVPAFLRDGDPDKLGYLRWNICKADFKCLIDAFGQKVARRLPSSYYSFISRYAFPAFQLGPIFFFGNTGDDTKWELSRRIFKDEFMSSRLLQSWYLQIGNPHKYNNDPICFDTKKGTECPIVQIDHEEILCNSRIKVIREIAPSFRNFVQDFIGEIDG
jgi:hypothetical protein